MTQNPDFSRSTIPPAAKPALPAVPPTVDGKPIGTGQLYMTDMTRKQLSLLGWKDGDPIPSNLAEKIDEVSKRIQADIVGPPTGLPADFKLKTPKAVDISSLSAGAQAELRAFMAEAKALATAQASEQAARAQVEARIPTGAHPSVAQALRTSITAQPSAILEFPQAKTGPVQDPEPEIPSMSAPNAPVPPLEMPAASDTSAVQPVTHCPRCHWPVAQQLETVPTAEDRQIFVASILANDRFRKEYALLGNKLRVIFRSLTAQEAETLYTQLRFDTQAGEIITEGDFVARLQTYRLVMSTEKLIAVGAVTEVPAALTIKYDQPAEKHETVLVPMTRWFWETVAAQEPVRRVVAKCHQEFQRLVEVMEAQAAEPDFW
jgi:hypothetical protein